MTNTEIRIGSLVKSELGILKVESILGSTYRVYCHSLDEDYLADYRLEDIKPIPLTEEWLVKFGFITMDAEVDFMEYAKEFEDGSFRFSVFNDGGLDMVNNYPFYITTTGQMKGWETEYKTEFKYVHQLQNLYFCLCGEELILKKD